jgi:hypothetical protein
MPSGTHALIYCKVYGAKKEEKRKERNMRK